MRLIDRERLLDELRNHYERKSPRQNAIMDVCVNIVRKQPIIEVEPKRGERKDEEK